MVNMLYQKHRAEIGFDVSKMVISTSATKTGKPTKKFEDAVLLALLDEDSSQTLKNCQKHWELTRELFPDAYMPLSERRKMGAVRIKRKRH